MISRISITRRKRLPWPMMWAMTAQLNRWEEMRLISSAMARRYSALGGMLMPAISSTAVQKVLGWLLEQREQRRSRRVMFW